MIEIQAPNELPLSTNLYKVFLAGSIEMGAAEKWQSKCVDELREYTGFIFNPRRDDWDSSWKQTIDDPKFNEQVTWELNALDLADNIILYFDPNTKSPISLLELGLHASSDKLIVCCPEGFWRKGNVDIVCKRYNIPCFDSLDQSLDYLKYQLSGELF